MDQHLKAIYVGDDGKIKKDLPCVTCHYNLRFAEVNRSCPECDTHVFRSLRLVYLTDHDPIWLRNMARACVAYLMPVGCVMSAFVLGITGLVDGPSNLGLLVSGLLMAVTFFGAFACGLLLTAKDDRDTTSKRRVLRVVARYTSVLGVGGLFVGVVVGHHAESIAEFLIVMGFFLIAISTFCLFYLAGSIATMIPSQLLRWQAIFVGLLLGSGLLMVASFSFFKVHPFSKTLFDWLKNTFPGTFVVRSSYLGWGVTPQPSTAWIDLDRLERWLTEFFEVAIPSTLISGALWSIPLLIWYHRRFREAYRVAVRQAEGAAATVPSSEAVSVETPAQPG